jgi:DNA repair protein SbcC/Rad50
MRLDRLRLREFRQHADTEIAFGPGVTGIIGPNGSGKTTLLEAIAWAIYGNRAARGDKDGIRNFRAKARASVRVELDFGLGAHRYRVVRGLNTAELHQDGQLVANSLTAVTEKLERALGLSYDEFFKTYFTGQKELAVMAALKGRTERAAFLSQVLGYDRLCVAQERVRERKNELAAELRGLEAGLPDRAVLESERAAAAARLDAARRAAGAAHEGRAAAEQAYEREEPRWKEWVEKEKRVRSLDGERRMAEHAVGTAKQECERLDREIADALKARAELVGLRSELAPIERLKRELAQLEHLQKEEAARREDQGQLEELARTIAALDRRVAELAPAAEGLAAFEREVQALGERVLAAERAEEQERTAWVRDRQDAETKRLTLREQYREVKEQRDLIVQLGPEGTCPTCRRPLGPEYAAVLAILDRQLEDITSNGNFFKQRVEQLAEPPPKLRAMEAARDRLLEERRRASGRSGELRAQLEERERAAGERRAAQRRAHQLEAQLRARPTGYDAQRHDAVRAELTKLEPVALEAAKLAERAQRAEILVREAELAERALSVHERRAQELAAAVQAEAFSEAAFAAARVRHERTARALREAELAVAETRGELTAAEAGTREIERRESERMARERQIAGLKGVHRLHDEIDRAFSSLRAELNAAMRPELSELASGFLADLTDGRYHEVDLTEDYQVTVLEEGVAKPVISGGEEDLANLVLRLAISQMIAERAGQPLSLLVLDEIFGSLDEARRQHVLSLLRRLADRFPQVILITHIEQVREGLDRVIRVDYDAARGTSAVRDDTATLGAADAGVAA